jgi:hypothetical protein
MGPVLRPHGDTRVARVAALSHQDKDHVSAADAEVAVEQGQRMVFLATAHPFMHPSYLDVARQIPGWDAVFTAALGAAMLIFGTIALLSAAVAVLGLRGVGQSGQRLGASAVEVT